MRLTSQALDALAQRPWPGNVRELKNLLESIVIFNDGEKIDVADLPAEIARPAASSENGGRVQSEYGEPRTMAEIERRAILETLQRTKGKRAEAARILGIGLRTLQRKLKDYKTQGILEETV